MDTTRVEPPPDDELSIFSHRHIILATAPIEAGWSSSVLFKLHHWHPPTLSKLTSARLPPSALCGLKHSVSLGTFPVPLDVDVPEGFSELLKNAPSPTDRDVNLNPQTIANFVRELNKGSESQGTQMQFFTFPIFSNTPDPALSPTLFPVWKWIKPDSTYRKAGFWEDDLHKAIEDGKWNSGKNLTILMAGVSAKTRQTIASSEMGYKFLSLERAEAFSERGGYA